jgi:quercetin dioxygenase-like cupin family protein
VSSRPRRVRTVLLVALALALTAAGGALAATAIRPAARTALDQPVVRTVLAEGVDPAGAGGQTLGLSRVTIGPGAQLATHRHPGTQASYVARGTLTYWVVRGPGVEVRRGSSADPGGSTLVRRIDPGEHGRIAAGQWIVERPGTIHHAANRGDVGIVILIASLFRDGAPPSIAVPEAR